MSWFSDYCSKAAKTDRLAGRADHVRLLAAGLLGETGSVLAELKKTVRDAEAYPLQKSRLVEEFGDLLWYFARLTTVLGQDIAAEMGAATRSSSSGGKDELGCAVALGAAVGSLLGGLGEADRNVGPELRSVWLAVEEVSVAMDLDLREAARQNVEKTRSRWPARRTYHRLFDEEFGETEQLPRRLEVEFRQIDRGRGGVVLLRCNGLNLGDRLTDNIEDPDFYRFHDIFHLAHAVYLGWSPIVRVLLNCKRKSDPRVDENQDGARARIVEEAVSAVVFSRAKQTRFYDGIDHVDYDLLKTVREFVSGFEVEAVPLWQWEAAILNGYRVFRLLRQHGGGKVDVDLVNRGLRYAAADRGRTKGELAGPRPVGCS